VGLGVCEFAVEGEGVFWEMSAWPLLGIHFLLSCATKENGERKTQAPRRPLHIASSLLRSRMCGTGLPPHPPIAAPPSTMYSCLMSLVNRWLVIVIGWSIVLALLMQGPQVLRMMRPEFQGVLTVLNSDETVYRARVQEAIMGRPEQAAEAFVGDPNLRGTQPAVLEAAIGILFSPTDLRAPTVLQILDSVIPVLLFLGIVAFFGLSGIPLGWAVAGGIVFTTLELYNLNRPVHQAGSTLVVVAAMTGILLGLRGSALAAAVGGALLGSLFGMTFWPWSFGWAWWGIMLVITAAVALRSRASILTDRSVRALLIAGCFGVLAGLPFILQLFGASRDPLWPDAVFRSGMHPSRLPESWAYSVLFFVIVGGMLGTFLRNERMRRHTPLLAMVVSLFIVMHQQVIHGQVFNFVSHYLMFMVVAAVGAVCLAAIHRRPLLIISGLAAAVYLAAIGYDGRFVLRQWNPANADWSEQHLASALPTLDALPRARILTDLETSGWISGFTHHDVGYNLYLKNVMMSHRELAERYCLTQLPVLSAARHIADQPRLIYPDARAAFPDAATKEGEIALVEEACADLDEDPAGSLQRYYITHVLWNSAVHPEWDLSRLKIPLKSVSAGEGWSLYGL